MHKDLEEILTQDNIKTTALVLQAVDAKCEDYYNDVMAKELGSESRPSEADISAAIPEDTKRMSMGNVIFCGYGYRPSVSIVATSLILVEEPEIAKQFCDSTISEI